MLPLFARCASAQWRALLEDTLPPDGNEPYPRAIWHYARGTAYAKTGRLPEARAELARLDAIAADPALARIKVKNINAAAALVQIARLTLQADIAAAEGTGRRRGAAARAGRPRSRTASSYDEPHLWLAPTRHALGAALLAAGRHDDAARVYREDLAHYPANGWSLAGLAEALRRVRSGGRGARPSRRRRASHGATPTFRCRRRAPVRAPAGAVRRRRIGALRSSLHADVRATGARQHILTFIAI